MAKAKSKKDKKAKKTTAVASSGDEVLEFDGWLESPVTERVLEETPERAFRLLRAIGNSARIMRAMMTRGYSRADQLEGFRLVQRTVGIDDGDADLGAAPEANAAMAELDAWDEPNLRILRAVLARKHKPLLEQVLGGLRPSTGAESVVVVETLLDRLDALARERDAQAQAALAALERRGYGAAERKRLRAVIEEAKRVPEVAPPPADAQERQRRRHNDLVQLREWYQEVAELARATVQRRDDLIRLGLARPGRPRVDEPADPS